MDVEVHELSYNSEAYAGLGHGQLNLGQGIVRFNLDIPDPDVKPAFEHAYPQFIYYI